MAHSLNDLQKAAHSFVVEDTGAGATDANVTSGASCRVFSISMTGDGVGTATVSVYNALTATGTPIIVSTEQDTITQSFGPQGIRFATGLTLVTSANNINAVVEYLIDA